LERDWRWGAVLLVVGVIDLAVRFGTGFNMVWIVRVEGPLFCAASLVLLRMYRQRSALGRWQRGMQAFLVIALGLAGIRAMVWAVGLPVEAANLLVLVLAGIGGGIILWHRHHSNAAA